MAEPVNNRNVYEPFWSAAKRNELRFPKCQSCRKFHWYPMKRCPHCRSEEIVWTEVEPVGQVYTWTIARHAFDPSFPLKPPYAVVLVEFEAAPGVRLVTNLVEGIDEVHIGMPVEAIFDQSGEPRVYVRPRAMAKIS